MNSVSFTELCEGIQHSSYALERSGTINQSTEELKATASNSQSSPLICQHYWNDMADKKTS